MPKHTMSIRFRFLVLAAAALGAVLAFALRQAISGRI
jgi:hypothetical protein